MSAYCTRNVRSLLVVVDVVNVAELELTLQCMAQDEPHPAHLKSLGRHGNVVKQHMLHETRLGPMWIHTLKCPELSF
jgi:hypothetical protein